VANPPDLAGVEGGSAECRPPSIDARAPYSPRLDASSSLLAHRWHNLEQEGASYLRQPVDSIRLPGGLCERALARRRQLIANAASKG
jgi:hypothetical protein